MMPSAHSSIREQEFAPLLFPLYSLDGSGTAAAGTPRTATPHRREDSSMSTQRRSATTPGSVHTETTPPTPPPPVMRLTDDMIIEEPSASKASRMAAVPPPMQSLTPMASTAGRPDFTIPFEAAPQYHDVWVTIFGFGQQDVPLILKEFSKCGDILHWGSFGQPNANFLHVQFQNKYAAQRALLRNGEQLSPFIIVGVKPLDPRHRAAIEQYQAGVSGEGAAVNDMDGQLSFVRPAALPDRPYRIEAPQQTPMPQPRSVVSKVVEFVFGF